MAASPVRNVLIDDATRDELYSFAHEFLNLDVSENAEYDELRAAVERAQPNSPLIFILEKPEVEAPESAYSPEDSTAGQGQVGSLGRGDPRVGIHIPVVDSDDDSGKADVLVGVNGRAWQIKRGHDVDVPYRVYLVMKDAIGERVDHNDMGDETVRPVKRINFNVISMPSEAEIKAWHADTDAEFCA